MSKQFNQLAADFSPLLKKSMLYFEANAKTFIPRKEEEACNSFKKIKPEVTLQKCSSMRTDYFILVVVFYL